MAAAQPNLNKLILPNTNTESFVPQENTVLREGWDATRHHGDPRLGIFLGFHELAVFTGVFASLLGMVL